MMKGLLLILNYFFIIRVSFLKCNVNVETIFTIRTMEEVTIWR